MCERVRGLKDSSVRGSWLNEGIIFKMDEDEVWEK